MNNPLPQSNVLAAIGSAVVVSVICTWTISTHFQAQTQREFDRIHRRLDALTGHVEYARGEPIGAPAPMDELWDMPEAPEPAEEGDL